MLEARTCPSTRKSTAADEVTALTTRTRAFEVGPEMMKPGVVACSHPRIEAARSAVTTGVTNRFRIGAVLSGVAGASTRMLPIASDGVGGASHVSDYAQQAERTIGRHDRRPS